MTWDEHHSRSEQLAAEAYERARAGLPHEARQLLHDAANEERLAFAALTREKRKTRGVTAVSAVALLHKAGDLASAEQFARELLESGELPPFAEIQLHDLLKIILTATMPLADIEAVRKSDALAPFDRLDYLYRKYFPQTVMFYVRSFHFPEEDARDFAQEAFLCAYRKIDQYRGDAEWAFLVAVARKVGYEALRSRRSAKRKATPADVQDLTFPEALSDQWDAEQENSLRRRQLKEAIAELPEGQRQCIRLMIEGFSYTEIAKLLRISVDAVKSRSRDAKKTLRAKLGGDEFQNQE